MAANNLPIFTLTPNVTGTKIGTTSAQVKSDGTCAGSGTDLMYGAFITGSNGSYIERVRFSPVASAAATNSVATTLRVYLSTVTSTVGGSPGATTSANTLLLGEVSVPAISASNSTAAVATFDLLLGFAIPTGTYIHVSQHVAQTTNQSWQGLVIGGNY